MTKAEAVLADMQTAMRYVEKAKPIIRQLLNGGEIMRVEFENNDVCRMLDETCGTDYFQVYNNNAIVWGIASRFQKVSNSGKPFNTFTVRKERESGAKTELHKRKFAIAHNGIYPYLTLQAYYTPANEEIASLAIARTVDVIDMAESEYAFERTTGSDKIGQAAFICVRWSDMVKANKGIKIFMRP